MYQRVLLTIGAMCVAACAGRAGPLFDYRPSDTPLRYDVSVALTAVVETPMGPQQSRDTTSVTVSLEVGRGSRDSRSVSAVFERIDGRANGVGSYDGGDLVGKVYAGMLDPASGIAISDAPETPSQLRRFFDPVSFLRDLLIPLPPVGRGADEPWSVHQENTEQTAMTVNTVVDGTARVVGDTVWNGVAAKIVVIEGTLQLDGSGTPPGAPGEVAMSLTGTTTTRGVWDAGRGVMLGYLATTTATGDVEIMGMDLVMPATLEHTQVVALRP